MSCGRKIGPYDCCSVVCGDCLELMKALPDGCVDAVITDPPYVGLKGGYEFSEGGVASGNRQSVSVGDVWNASLEWLSLVEKIGAGQLITFTTYHAMKDLLEQLPGKLMVIGAWHKPNAHPGNPSSPHYSCEYFVGSKLRTGCDWHGIGDFISASQDFGGCVSRGERIRNTDGSNAHPTQKPLEVMKSLITEGMETILDPFCGTGTTLVAAKRAGKHFLGFEISEDYCRIARERIALVEAQPTLFEPKPEQYSLPTPPTGGTK